METKKRKVFLENFLQLFGVDRLELTKITLDKVYGQAFFKDNDRQDFCWQMSEEKVPQDSVLELIKILQDNNLVDIDKLTETPESLFAWTKQNDYNNFIVTFEELMAVNVRMIDDGEETDLFFLHE
jgi:hypothetical protein